MTKIASAILMQGSILKNSVTLGKSQFIWALVTPSINWEGYTPYEFIVRLTNNVCDNPFLIIEYPTSNWFSNISSLPWRSMQYTIKEHEVLSEDLSYDKPEGACEPDLALFHDILRDIWSLD